MRSVYHSIFPLPPQSHNPHATATKCFVSGDQFVKWLWRHVGPLFFTQLLSFKHTGKENDIFFYFYVISHCNYNSNTWSRGKKRLCERHHD